MRVEPRRHTVKKAERLKFTEWKKDDHGAVNCIRILE
jgi:hypothetical protein